MPVSASFCCDILGLYKMNHNTSCSKKYLGSHRHVLMRLAQCMQLGSCYTVFGSCATPVTCVACTAGQF